MDDFFIPKHNFHPKDIIHDIKVLGGEVYYFDGDLRDYNHEIEKKKLDTTKMLDIFQLVVIGFM